MNTDFYQATVTIMISILLICFCSFDLSCPILENRYFLSKTFILYCLDLLNSIGGGGGGLPCLFRFSPLMGIDPHQRVFYTIHLSSYLNTNMLISNATRPTRDPRRASSDTRSRLVLFTSALKRQNGSF